MIFAVLRNDKDSMDKLRMMKKNIWILMVTAILGFQSCGGSKSIVDKDEPRRTREYAFDFVDSKSLAPVLDLAAEEGKLVFLDIYTSWCLPCKMMDNDVFTNQQTADIINQNFISYKVDAEQANGPDLAFIYDVKQYPTLLFLDTKGRVIEKGTGAMYHSQLVDLASSALAKSKEL